MEPRLNHASGVFLLAVLLPGCGTLTTQMAYIGGEAQEPVWIYTGVRYDLNVISGAYHFDAPPSFAARLCDYLYTLDVPISAVADTALLPLTGVETLVEVRKW